MGTILNNRRIVFAKLIISNYLSHYDLKWLFINGDIARHHAPNMGLLYLVDLPFLLVGIYQLVTGTWSRKTKFLIFAWFLLAPIPASITSGVPHAVRTLNFLPTFQIFIALGIVALCVFIKKKRVSNTQYYPLLFFAACYSILAALNFGYYLDQYFVQQNIDYSQEWQYGYKQAVNEVKKIEGKYDKIVVSNTPYLDQSYMFFLFYLQYPPAQYQKESSHSSGGFREDHSFGKYEFRPIDWSKEQAGHDILYIGRPQDFSGTYTELKIIKFLDGTPAIMIAQK